MGGCQRLLTTKPGMEPWSEALGIVCSHTHVQLRALKRMLKDVTEKSAAFLRGPND